MFSYYGSKSKIAHLYPKPLYNKIIEPFAGSARYSLLYWERDIVLYETYPKVIAIWEYLINATKKDILSLPDVKLGDDIRNYNLSDSERWLIGYHLQRGNARPGNLVNKRCNWNKEKLKIADNVYKVKHWKLIKSSCFDSEWESGEITYFVDPPYSVQKHGYNHGKIDYIDLRKRIESTSAHFIVCGNTDDTWAPFVPLVEMHGTVKKHIECIWEIKKINY